MRGINHIVAPAVVLAHRGGRPPSRDFADELGKGDDRMTGNRPRHQVAQGNSSHQAPAVTSRLADGGEPIAANAVVSAASDVVSASSESGISTGMSAESAQQLDVVIQPTGITEVLAGSRVFGIHLLAGAYLSELYASTGQATSVASSNTAPSGPEGMSEQIPDASSGVPHDTAGVVAMMDTSSRVEVGEAPGLPAMKAVEVAKDEARFSAPPRVAPEASQEAPWPEDSLRLTRQLDGSLTLWLRDYRMDDTQAIRVVGAIVKEAGSRGMHLGRILLNGREVWISPNEY